MSASRTLPVDDVSTLAEQVPYLHRIDNAFQLSISSQCGKTLFLVCVPQKLVNDPANFFSWTATQSFIDQNLLPPKTTPALNINFNVVGVLDDYSKYDWIGKAVTKLSRYEDLFRCLNRAKDRWSNTSVIVRPREGLTAEKQPRARFERKRQPSHRAGTQFSNQSVCPPNLLPLPAAPTANPPPLPAAPTANPPPLPAAPTAALTLSQAETPRHPTSPQNSTNQPLSSRNDLESAPPPASTDPLPVPSPSPTSLRPPDDLHLIAPNPSPAALAAAETPPPAGRAPSSSMSPVPPTPAGLPFLLAQIPGRFHHFFGRDGITPDLYPLFPTDFEYGADATDASYLQLTCILLMTRQTGRRRVLSYLVELNPAGDPGFHNFSFLGTRINGLTVPLYPYQAPPTSHHKRCSFGCGWTKLTNKDAVLRHHKPKQFTHETRDCDHFPDTLHIASPAEFCRKKEGGVGLQVYYHEYRGQGTLHFKTQLLQVGQSLFAFALKQLRMSRDPQIAAWASTEDGW